MVHRWKDESLSFPAVFYSSTQNSALLRGQARLPNKGDILPNLVRVTTQPDAMSSLRTVSDIAVMAPTPHHALLQPWGNTTAVPAPPQYPTGLQSEAQRTAVPGTRVIVSGGALVLWGDGPLAIRIPAVAFFAKSISYGHRIQTLRIGRTWFAPGNQTKLELIKVGTKIYSGVILCFADNLEPKLGTKELGAGCGGWLWKGAPPPTCLAAMSIAPLDVFDVN